MKLSFTYFFLLLVFFCKTPTLSAQTIDVDSLLIVLLNDTRANKNPQEIINQAHKATKIAPDYLDYYLLMGKNFERIPIIDSAKFYYKKVIGKSDKYPEAYNYLINLEINNNQLDDALVTIETASAKYPDNKPLYDTKKLDILSKKNDQRAELNLLNEIMDEDSKNTVLKNRFILLSKKINSDRIGFQYTNTSFNRDGYGPWQQGMVQYIRARNWGTYVININSMNRKSDFSSDVNGIQFEGSSYIFTTKRNYIYTNIAFSNNEVFPKIRLGASYHISFSKKWEASFGARYIQAVDDNFTSVVLGIGRYYHSFWFNLNSYIQGNEKVLNPALTFNTRYYFGNSFDYLLVTLGYGTSPEDKSTVGMYENRVSLNSYRMGLGANKNFLQHYIIGLQFLYNNQEYIPDHRQNEYELQLSFQYKF